MASRGPTPKGPGRRLSMLRTSFSVPNMPHEQIATKSAADRRKALGLGTEMPDNAIEEDGEDSAAATPKATPDTSAVDIPSDKTQSTTDEAINNASGDTTGDAANVSVDESTASIAGDSTTLIPDTPSTPLGQEETAPKVTLKRAAPAAVPHPKRLNTLYRPRSAPNTNGGSESSTLAAPSAGAHISRRSEPPLETPPPEGCEFVDLEELPQLKMNERRRRVAFEREFVNIMRDLFFEREKVRLAEVSDLSDDYIEVEARNNAAIATYHQLKQSVGQEAKVIRDKRHSEQQKEMEQQHADVHSVAAQNQSTKPVINEQHTTMATLCKDLPFGEANAAFDDYELARVNRRRDTMRVFRAKMWSKGLYQPKEEEKLQLQEAFRKYQDERKDRSGKIKVEQSKKFSEIDHEAESLGANGGHPQAAIEIQADGSISLVGTQYDRHQNNRSQREGGLQGPRTEVDPTEQVINSFSFSTKERPDRWTKEETEKFYEAVSALGTDFNLISHLFPTRSRNQIKTKFKYEERRNPAKLQIHMVSKRKFNLDSYSKVSNVDIQEVDSIEDELEKIRKEHDEQMKLEEASRQEAKAEDRKPLRKPKKERF